MKKNRKKLKKYHPIISLLFYVSIIFLFTSCVYYNTFYNAEKSFENATRIIEESPLLEDSEVPPQAKKLLDESIANSYIVLDKYSESKYVDDAYFIISKARFLKSEYPLSIDYLDRLIDEFPTSGYLNEAKIWKAYSQFRMGQVDSSKIELEYILNNLKLTQKEKLITLKFQAEIALGDGNVALALSYYEEAIQLSQKASNKVAIYMKLIDISEKNDLYPRMITYLDKLSQVASNQIKLDAKMDWIKYSRQLGNYNEIVTEIDNLLGQSEYQSIYMKLELEQAKVYLDQKDFEATKLLLSDFTSTYERKNESAEAFYHLGYIALMEDFDLVLAKDYFDSAKKEKSSSKYGKKAKDMKVVIEQFTTLQEEYEYRIENLKSEEVVEDTIAVETEEFEKTTFSQSREHMSIPTGRSKADATPDSLLFTIAEKLMFDFNKPDIALEKFKFLVEKFPDSKFRSQSIFVLSNFFPKEEWKIILATEYPESSYMNMVGHQSDTLNTILSKRDKIWDLISVSFDSTATSFYNLYSVENDTVSLYYYSFILDHYLNDLGGAITHYQEYVSFEGTDEFTTIAKNRISEIEESVFFEEELVQQKMNYSNAMEIYFSGEPIDSVISILDLALEGRHSDYRTSAERLKSAFSNINAFNLLISPDSTGQIDSLIQIQLDSIYYSLGDIFDYDLGFSDSAQHYYKKVINDFEHSNFRYESMLAMNELDPNGVWGTLISAEFPDSLAVGDSTRSVKGIIIDSLNEDFIATQNDLLTLLADASENFVKPEIDSLLLDNESDSIMVEYAIPEFPMTEDMLPEIFDPIELAEENIISKVEEDTLKQDLPDTFSTQLISNDTNKVGQSISEFPVDSTWAEYIILHGESLRSISQKEFGSEEYWSLIYDWNKAVLGENPALVFPYQILKLRKPISYEIEIENDDLYIVSTGETLWSIARLIYKDEYAWSILLHDNKEKLKNPDKIYPGYPLLIRTRLVESGAEN